MLTASRTTASDGTVRREKAHSILIIDLPEEELLQLKRLLDKALTRMEAHE